MITLTDLADACAASRHHDDELLTAAELDVARKLAAAHSAFCALPDYRPGEFDEWVAAVHRLQDIVMSRAAVRAYPHEFKGLFLKPGKDPR